MTKTKIVIKSLIIGIIMILFPVLSGVLIGVLTSITENDYSIIGLFIQAAFIFVAIVIAFIYIKKKKIKPAELNLPFKVNPYWIYFLPCILIFIPTLFGGFVWKGSVYFIGVLLLYLLVGIAEELYFRGLIPHTLKKGFSTKSIIIISTIIFGLGHCAVIFNGGDISLVLLTILNALIFGWLAIELAILTDNITLLMVIHFLFDFESKFILATGNELIIFEIIRGAIMVIYAIVLIYVLKKKKLFKQSA